MTAKREQSKFGADQGCCLGCKALSLQSPSVSFSLLQSRIYRLLQSPSVSFSLLQSPSVSRLQSPSVSYQLVGAALQEQLAAGRVVAHGGVVQQGGAVLVLGFEHGSHRNGLEKGLGARQVVTRVTGCDKPTRCPRHRLRQATGKRLALARNWHETGKRRLASGDWQAETDTRLARDWRETGKADAYETGSGREERCG